MYDPLLVTFVCVADCGSFNRAAEKLYISPPSVMKQINTLERRLELKLLERTNQGIRLTPAGRVIYQHARFLFTYAENALKEARQAQQRENAVFSIGSSLLNPCKPFMDLWYQVNRYFPGYKLHVVPFEDNHEGILTEISALGAKFDFLVGVCDSAQWLDRCRFYQLGTYQHCVAVSRDHPLAQKKRLTITDLYGQTIMMVKRGDSCVVDAIRAEIQRHPEIRIEDTTQFYDIEVFNRCEAGQSVMLTIECWRDVHPALVTIPVEWDYPIPYGLLYAMEPSAEVLRLLETVKELRRMEDSGEEGG